MIVPLISGTVHFKCCAIAQQMPTDPLPTCRVCGTIYRVVLEPLPRTPTAFPSGARVRLTRDVVVHYPAFPVGVTSVTWTAGAEFVVGADPYGVLCRGGDAVFVVVDVPNDRRTGTFRILVPVPPDSIELSPACAPSGELAPS
jgi:hypothetical protein